MQQILGGSAQDLCAEVCKGFHAATRSKIWRYPLVPKVLASAVYTSLYNPGKYLNGSFNLTSGAIETLKIKHWHKTAGQITGFAQVECGVEGPAATSLLPAAASLQPAPCSTRAAFFPSQSSAPASSTTASQLICGVYTARCTHASCCNQS